MRETGRFTLAALAGAAALTLIGDGSIPLGPYALAVAAAAAFRAMSRGLRRLPPVEADPPAMIHVGGVGVTQPVEPIPIVRWRGLLARSASSQHASVTRLHPQLHAMTISHLTGRGIDVERQPALASEELGADSFNLIFSPPEEPITTARVEQLVDRLDTAGRASGRST